ncbi:MAG: PKD domain-containing protein [Crocinitomicaceae bacterium]|nr:PKD domain-containing protein [Crocinitomicaceae bacterium]MDP4868111.1 PKD domain-containing protein [Crocinitomicaceae bacterium]
MVIRLHLFLVIFSYTFLSSIANAQCPQVVSLGPNQNLCGPDTTTLTPTFTGNSGAPSSINWFLNGTIVNSTASQLDVLSSAPGTYVIEATFGACVVYDTILITSTNLTLSLPFVSANGVYYNPIDVNGTQTYPLCSGLGTTTILIENAAYQNNLNPAGTTYSITYGSGTAQTYIDSAAQTATLGNNYFTLTAQNGACNLTQTYNIYSGSNPFVSLGALNSVGICPGNPVTFVIDPTLAPGIFNPPGTVYTLSFNDDTSTVLTYNNLTNDQIVYYIFGTTSCGITYPTGSNFPNNTFYAQVTAQNACGQTFSTVSPITVNSLPTPGFTISDTTICTGTQITATNTGVSGNIVSTSAPYNCTGQAKFYWLLGGGTLGVDFTLNSGTLGSYNGNYNSLAGNGSQTLAITYNTPGTYSISQIQYNSCGLDTLIQQICVIEAPICGFSLDTLSGCSPLNLQVVNSTVAPTCNASPIPLNYLWSLNNPGGMSGSISSSTAAQPTVILNNTTNTAQTYVLTLNVSPQDPAGGEFGTPNCNSTCQQSITVFPELQINPPPATTICHGSTLNTSLSANVPSNLYWQATNQANVTGESTTPQNTNLINDQLTNNGLVNQTVTYSVYGNANLGTCPDSLTFSVTVLPNYTMNVVNNLSFCAGVVVPIQNFSSSYTGITYSWVNNNPTIGLAASGTGPLPNFTALNNGVTPQIAQIIVTPNQGACIGVPVTFDITILPLPIVDTVLNQTLCPGATSNAVSFGASLNNSTFSWTNNNTSIGLGASGNGDIPSFTVQNSTLNVQTASVTVVGNSGSCAGPALSFTISILPTPQILNPGNQVLCSGANTNAITFSGQPSGNTYNWANNNPTIGLGASGQGDIPSFVANNTGSSPDTAFITFSATNNGCSSSSISFQIIATPIPSIAQESSFQLCHQQNFSGLAFSNPNAVAGTSYIWTNDNASIGLGVSGNGLGLPAFVASNLGTALNVANISVQASASGCLSAPILFQISINPNPIVLAQGPFYYCDNTQTNVSNFSSTVSGVSYNWTLDNTAIGLNQSSGQDSIPSFTAQNNTSNPINGNFNITATINGCVGPVQSFQYIVNPLPVIDTVSSIVVCALTNVDINFGSSTPSNGNSYSWVNNEPIIGLGANGAGDISFLSQNLTSIALNAQVDITPTYTNGTASCLGLPTSINITVHPSLIVNPIQDQSICVGNSTAAVGFSSNIAGSSFSWTNNNPSIGLGISGSSNLSSFIGINQGTQLETAQISVVPTYSFGSQLCTGQALNFEINVLPLPLVDPTSDETFCHQGQANINFSSAYNPVSYSWSSLPNGIGLPSIGQGNINFISQNNTANNLSATAFVTATYNLNGVSCTGPNDTILITVLPQVMTSGSPDQLLCNGDSSAAVIWNSSLPNSTFSWLSLGANSGFAASGFGNTPPTLVSNTSNTQQQTALVGLATLQLNGVSCPGIADTVLIDVNPTPILSFGQANQVLCSGDSSQIVNLNSTVSGANFSWTLGSVSAGLSGWVQANGTGSLPAALLTNSSNSTTSVQLTAFASTGGLLSCPGPSSSYTIQVLAVPFINPVQDVFACNQSSLGNINFSGTANTISWANNNPSIGLAASGTGNIGSFNTQNSSNQVVNTAQLIVQSSYNLNALSCVGNIDTFNISVAPITTVQAVGNQVWCNGANTNAINLTGTGTSYNWSNNNPSIGLASTGQDSIPSFTAANPGLSNNTALLSINPIYTLNGLNCPGSAINFNINIVPGPSMNAQQDLFYCANSPISALPFTGTASNYSWTNTNTTIGLAASGTSTSLPAFISSNLDSIYAVASISVIPVIDTGLLTCVGLPEIFEIHILPVPNVDSIANQELCSGASTNQVVFSGNVANTQFQWQHNGSNLPLSSNGTGNIGAYTLTNTTATPLQVAFQVTPIVSAGALACPGTALNFDWTILPQPNIINAGPLVYCTGTSVAAQGFSGTANSYTWVNNNISTGLPASGQDSLPAFLTTNTSAVPNEALLTVTPLYQTALQTCAGTALDLELVVNPVAFANLIPNQSYCHNELSNTTLISGNATSYLWSNDNQTIGLPANGSNQVPSFLSQNLSNQDTIAQISILPFYANLGLSCPGDSSGYSITIHPQPSLLTFNDTAICNGGNILYNLAGTVAASYTWSASNNSAISGAAQTPQTNPILAQTLVNSSSTPQQITYTISPTSSFGCVGPDSSIVVTVQPDVQLSVPATMEICSGSPVNANLNANVSSNFSWFVTVDNPNVSGESISASIGTYINDVLVNNTNVNQIVVYAITPLAVVGGCAGGVQTLSVLIKPPLELLNVDTLAICSGTAVNLGLFGNTNVSFTWYADQNINVTGESTSLVSSAMITDVLQNMSNQVQEVLYHVTGTAAINGCSTPIFPIWVQVLPTPQVSAPNNLTLCHNTTQGNIAINGNNAANTYDWAASGPNIGMGSNSGQQIIPAFTTSNTSNTELLSTISITPSLLFNGQTCLGTASNFDILVLPDPNVQGLIDLTFCEGVICPQQNFTGSVPGTTFNWSNTNVGIGLGTIGTNTLPSFLTQTTAQQTTSAQIVVIPNYTSNNLTCTGTPADFTILVNSLPIVLSSNLSICSGAPVDLALDATIPSNFVWQATAQPEVYGETANTAQNSNLIDDTLSQTTNIVQGVEYTVVATAIATGCQSLPNTIAVSVNPLPQINFIYTGTTLCDQSPVQFQNNTTGSNNFLWNFGDGTSSILNNPNHTYPGPGTFIVNLSTTDANTGCVAQDSLAVQIGSLPIASFEVSDSIGCGSLDVTFFADSLNQGWSYLWDFGNGQTSPQLGTTNTQFDQLGCYDLSLTVTNAAGCTAQTTYTDGVCVFANPVAAFEASDYILDSNQPLVSFTNNSLNAVSYSWDFGDGETSFATDPQHMYQNAVATYTIQLVAYNEVNCSDTSTAKISVVEDLSIYVPNSFTPNDDENNQQFLPILSAGFKNNTYRLLIFDRWGEVVFESRDPEVGWDGHEGYSSTPCQDGTYTWKISLVIAASQETKVFMGHVNLLR